MPSVLVTGAGRGIGFAFAQQYAAEGWRVFATCRDPERAAGLEALARETQGRVSLHSLDVGARPQIEALVRQLAAEPLDVLLNNAGVYGPRPQELGAIDDAAWASVFDTNVMGPLRMAEALADNVASSERKVIATLSSNMGSIGGNSGGGAYIYRSSKAAVNAVVKSLSVDLAPRGIVCVCFHPGWVGTDMGGASAPLSADQSVAGMRRVIDGLGPADSGRFLNHEGSAITW